jgi:hypothetical protein
LGGEAEIQDDGYGNDAGGRENVGDTDYAEGIEDGDEGNAAGKWEGTTKSEGDCAEFVEEDEIIIIDMAGGTRMEGGNDSENVICSHRKRY